MPNPTDTSHSTAQRPLYGLVLAGGYSRRMGRDKGLLPIGNLPAREHTARLLESCCDRVFLSLRPDQPAFPSAHEHATNAALTRPVIPDQFPGEGPLGALHSAFAAFPGMDWFVLPCDLPNMTGAWLRELAASWQGYGTATRVPDVLLFRHPDRPMPEPLCGIWAAWNAPLLASQFHQGERAVKRLLGLLTVHEYAVNNSDLLENKNYL
jgi:molybdopterin-guanine dinucleotide biosynthesis protein A